MRSFTYLSLFAGLAVDFAQAAAQAYTWKNVKIGGGGGFVPNIVFNPSQKGLAYARTDIGSIYKLNADDTWTPLVDFADNSHWDYWGSDALATDPVTPSNLYVAVGMYTNSYDPNNGSILKSTDYGSTWTATQLPFKVGGNMPGRGMGERLAVDPNNNKILFFGARSGHGLWKSADAGATWTQVKSFPSVGTYIPDPTDTTGYNSDIIGLSWVTFDPSAKTTAGTSRIFVGVANLGSSNVFVTNDGGSTWSAVAGQNSTFMPHKGVLSPAEQSLYVSYSNGAGPYDGTLGYVSKYNITAGTWATITPPQAVTDNYYGFGGLAVDLQKPGTVMVAALNEWWPDANIFRSTDGGKTWSEIWEWTSYPTLARYFSYDTSLAPWIGGPLGSQDVSAKLVGWMIEGLSIDPFDSNHWLYGTGETIYGGHDLLKWDTVHNVTIKSLADGVEETAIQGLISPPVGPSLLSAVGDVGGFVHNSLTTAPSTGFVNPTWATTSDIDFAGQLPTNIVRCGTGDSSTGKQVALSTNSGATWNQDYGAADNVTGGHIALSASADTVLWSSSSNGVLVSRYTNAFTPVSIPSGSVIASDKVNNSIFYAASGSSFYISTNNGVSFTSPSKLGTSQYPVKIAVHPSISGDVWVSSDAGLFHTTNSGASFTAISGITEAWAIALGAPKTTGGYPAVFAAASIGGLVAYWRSDDQGLNWVQINDAAHGFGSASANVLTGDPRIYGRVYVGTNGRGIFYGDISGSAPPVSVSSTSTSTTSTTTSTSKSTSSTTTTSSSTKSTSTTTSTTTTSSTKSTTTSSTSSTKSTTTTSSSSSTKTTSTSSSSTKTSSTAGPTQTPYGQCGGAGYTGPTVCAAGWTCTVGNPYYSQCTQ
ncbi:Oligoxyloglucan reducing end-specific cellobiohydrolase [Sistotremastrum niveocremeum HHB9708]|uniref:Oligoxyloglucan reducing end-specific cellobiohydrolase n=1 Tax=Sistotremastrum niveocremeum HHB9708 TaxID=1314777 RepID=A0A164W2P7_9AGAM|nr:Oligoxyloglucan reducing end-specific cellobiohydrolase [Sistotremastrum niveocremeum HHB9708]